MENGGSTHGGMGGFARTEISSYTSAGSGDSASATLMSSHAMKMGLYSINLVNSHIISHLNKSKMFNTFIYAF